MAALENVSTDDLRRVLAEVEGKETHTALTESDETR